MLLPRAREIARQIVELNPDMLAVMKNLIETRNTESLASALARERQGFDQFLSQHLKSGQ